MRDIIVETVRHRLVVGDGDWMIERKSKDSQSVEKWDEIKYYDLSTNNGVLLEIFNAVAEKIRKS